MKAGNEICLKVNSFWFKVFNVITFFKHLVLDQQSERTTGYSTSRKAT